MKYYKYVPIVKTEELPQIKNVGNNELLSIQRHEKRQLDALTEFICQVADVSDSTNVRSLFLKYEIKLVENSVDGSRVISASFPDKRFY